MAIEALYPSRRYPQRNNPLLRRERRRHMAIVAMAVFHISPNEASAAARPAVMSFVPAQATKPARHIRVIPLYRIPPEQAASISAYGD